LPEREGSGLQYTSAETYTENEQTVFNAKGVVTANGKEHSFSVSLIMERSYSASESMDIRAGDAVKDPLVINLEQGHVALSGKRIQFGINMDGVTEDMPTLGHESGFLIIDKNGNGIVDNGSELFGPATTDGFRELARYDEDRNNWIDEGDSAYRALRVWRSSGDLESLETLSELQIGAIYTGSTDTPFEIKNNQHLTEAMIRQSGVYLREDGTAGTVQKLDIAV
jgi:hypothetical protein